MDIKEVIKIFRKKNPKLVPNSDWTKIDKRKQAGERLSDILNDMKVLY
jgi:hypothetical protein